MTPCTCSCPFVLKNTPISIPPSLQIRLYDLEAERNRRLKAEAIIARTKPGGLRMSDFPKVRDVLKNLDHASEDAFRWIDEASAIASSHAAFTPTMQSILVNTFVVSSETIRRHLDERMRNLSAFLGSSEPVTLSGDDSMNLDPQFVLYESLCKNYQSIVPMESDNMRDISNDVLRRCDGLANAKAMIFGEPWSSYQTLLKSYITVMLEVRITQPHLTMSSVYLHVPRMYLIA